MVSNFGLLVSRVIVGGTLASHGAQKAFGWFGGPGPEKTAGFMESLGFVPGDLYGTIAGSVEMAAGSLMMLGLGGPLGPALTFPVMIVAQSSVHAKNGFYAQDGGIEMPLLNCAAALAIASSGFGTLSLDSALGATPFEDERLAWAVLVGAAVAGFIALAQRREPPVTIPDGATG